MQSNPMLTFHVTAAYENKDSHNQLAKFSDLEGAFETRITNVVPALLSTSLKLVEEFNTKTGTCVHLGSPPPLRIRPHPSFRCHVIPVRSP